MTVVLGITDLNNETDQLPCKVSQHLKCWQCNQKFTTRRPMQIHQLKEHRGMTIVSFFYSMTIPTPFACDICMYNVHVRLEIYVNTTFPKTS